MSLRAATAVELKTLEGAAVKFVQEARGQVWFASSSLAGPDLESTIVSKRLKKGKKGRMCRLVSRKRSDYNDLLLRG
jgi:hypothetical protein